MSLFSRIGLCAAAVMAAASLSAPAFAADEGFCRDYARETVGQVRSAYDSRRCGWAVRQNPARWNPDYRAQMDWCRHTSRKNVDRERNARTDTLAQCQRGGRGPDDRDGDDRGPGPGGHW
jgi:hypothetical protein